MAANLARFLATTFALATLLQDVNADTWCGLVDIGIEGDA